MIKKRHAEVDDMTREERIFAMKNNFNELYSYVAARLDDPELDENTRLELLKISDSLFWVKMFC